MTAAPPVPVRFAVLGLYNSGSSALAGMLHHLGANLGPPFFRDRPDRHSSVYEAADLAAQLRVCWDEPGLTEQVPAASRVAFLGSWVLRQETRGLGPVGMKHPLLALCADDVRAAWGPATRFIWARRPLADSMAGLVRRGWFPGREAVMQQRLWDAIEAVVARGVPVTVLDWGDTQREPAAAARRLVSLLGLAPSAEQMAAAVAFVRPEAA